MEYKEDRIERYQISGAAEGCVADEYGARYIYYEEDDCADSSIFHHFLMAVNIPVLFILMMPAARKMALSTMKNVLIVGNRCTVYFSLLIICIGLIALFGFWHFQQSVWSFPLHPCALL